MCDHPFPSNHFSTTYICDLCTDWNFVTFFSLHIVLNLRLFSCPLLCVWPCKLGCVVEGTGVLVAWDTRRKRLLHETAGGYGWRLVKEMSAQHSTHSPVPQTHPSLQMDPLLWGGEMVMVLHCKEIFWHCSGESLKQKSVEQGLDVIDDSLSHKLHLVSYLFPAEHWNPNTSPIKTGMSACYVTSSLD